jgi:hypothetical protein
MYDIIFVINELHTTTNAFNEFKKHYPLAKSAKTYSEAKKKVFTKAFWVVWPNLKIDDNFDFKYEIPTWDLEYVHVFLNDGEHNGICLIPVEANVSEREFSHRFFVNKKELDINASTTLKQYDIVFISYNEPNADENYNTLLTRFPFAKRVNNVKGIHQAHIKAASIVTTPMFWVVDGDAQIVDDFNFDLVLPEYDYDSVHVWRSLNPVNNLQYGYGGVKLLPSVRTLEMDTTRPDMTTAISDKFNIVDVTSNITAFNTDSFNTWKSAFRECVKLASKTIQGQLDEETEDRLYIWCNVAHGDYAEDAICGARAGRTYGEKNADDVSALSLINDFEWLSNYYQQTR